MIARERGQSQPELPRRRQLYETSVCLIYRHWVQKTTPSVSVYPNDVSIHGGLIGVVPGTGKERYRSNRSVLRRGRRRCWASAIIEEEILYFSKKKKEKKNEIRAARENLHVD